MQVTICIEFEDLKRNNKIKEKKRKDDAEEKIIQQIGVKKTALLKRD